MSTSLTLFTLFYASFAQKISITTSTSKDDYLFTSVNWGTPEQSFNVLLDTTHGTSWVYNESANTHNKRFNPSSSTTFSPSNTNEAFSYQNASTIINLATDTFTLSGKSLINTQFGIASDNFTITDNEALSGFLSLNRQNTILSALTQAAYIDNASMSIDVSNNALHMGTYTPSSIANVSNASTCAQTTNQYLVNDWVFDIEVKVNGIPLLSTNTFKGVIDAASPFITIYAKDATAFASMWQIIDGSNGGALHCNFSTRYCKDRSIMDSMTVYFTAIGYNVSIFAEDVLTSDGYIQFLYGGDGDTVFNVDAQGAIETDYILFLGRPFLKHTVVTLDYAAETATFYAVNATIKKLDWTTIGIVFGSVVAFAAAFFGIYCWKFGRIAARSVNNNGNVEEQVSLLRGPVQAVGTGSGVGSINQASSGVYSGLDSDDDDFQRQQAANRLAAIEAQQHRVQQQQNEQIAMQDEQKQSQKNSPKVVKSSGKIGSALGAVKPDDKEAIRQRRLKFLEKQESQQLNPNDDDAALQ